MTIDAFVNQQRLIVHPMNLETPFWLDPSLVKARKPRRLPAALDVQLRIDGTKIVGARLYDFSRRGFGVECHELILIGSTIEVALPQLGWVPATVQWSIGNRMGGQFLKEIAIPKI